MEKCIVIILVTMPGVWCGKWKVTTENKCAMRGTSVVIPCSYDYPGYHTVTYVQWYKKMYSGNSPLSQDSFEYIGNKLHNCSLRIKNVLYADQGNYVFRFETNYDGWTSSPAYLTVKDLTLVASVNPRIVTEEEAVTLTCKPNCITQTHLQFVWFREGQRVSNTAFKARKEDSGRYSCALLGVQSPSVSLNVQYAPKNVMLTVSPSEDVVQGGTVVLSCNSQANPPVAEQGYSLFKDGKVIGFGPSLKIVDVQPSDQGIYYCQAGNNISWRGSNLFQSSKVHMNVQYQPMNISISLEFTEVTEGSDVNLICNSDANPPANNYTWHKQDPSSSNPSPMVQVGSGPVLSMPSVEVSHTGHYICQARNRLGGDNSAEVLLTVKSKTTAAHFFILAGVGVSLFVAFVLALLLYWKKQRRHPDIKMTAISERGSSSGVETSNDIYANVMFHPPSSNREVEYASPEEILYTTVTIKPKNPSQKHHKQIKVPEMDESVIYAQVEKSS